MIAIVVFVIFSGVFLLRRERLRRRSKPFVEALESIDASKGIYRVAHRAQVKFRRAEDVPDQLRDELIQICQTDPRISACYLFDVMEPETGQIHLRVNIQADDREALHSVGPHMQRVFKRFPEYTDRFFIGVNGFPKARDDLAVWRRAD
jgi:hypothetical protein